MLLEMYERGSVRMACMSLTFAYMPCTRIAEIAPVEDRSWTAFDAYVHARSSMLLNTINEQVLFRRLFSLCLVIEVRTLTKFVPKSSPTIS